WFPPVDFNNTPSEHSLANLFTAMAFMHFNIAVGIVLILIARLLYAGCGCRATVITTSTPTIVVSATNAWAAVCRFVFAPALWIACCFLVASAANIAVTSHLFRRVDCMARTLDTRFSVPDCMKWTFDQRKHHRPKPRFTGPEV